MKISIFLNS